MNRMIEDARSVLDAQPFSQLVQAELTRYTCEGVELRLPVAQKIQQQHGFVHGGVVSYLADNALTFAGGAALGPAVVTSEYKINYVRPAMGRQLVARASVVHAGRSQAVCRCDVYAVDAAGVEKLCAIAQGTIALMGAPKSE
ncbi:PaaI family thioesterase [Melaminivora jejuensis]|uniref:PaaI family thioesterase n=1 Tax=Melaminivora jejuensis TaxID=1267217 RepID=UPI001AE0A89E|nr:PaaI family thioesterase [Melaminivora jejuensis]UHJ65486.1 PaaI family thioesterase [Melaminivora jejuensis]